MPKVDAIIFKKKGVRKKMQLILDDDEPIISCIKQAMKEHNLNEVRVEDMSGTFKDGELNYFEGNRYKMVRLVGKTAFRASGMFKLSYDELYGSLHVSINERHPITGTLANGKATQGFQVGLSFVQLLDAETTPNPTIQ